MRSTKQQKTQLQIALLGMDERSCKIMSMFFKGPCEGHAIVVEEKSANVAIIDTRFEHSKELLEKSLAQGKMRAIIVLSSQTHDRINNDKIIYLDKPISANPMFEALDWAKDISEGKIRQKPAHSQRFQPAHITEKPATASVQLVKPTPDLITTQPIAEDNSPITPVNAEALPIVDTKDTSASVKQPTDNNILLEIAKTTRCQQIDESEFAEFIGGVLDIDLDNPLKQRTASYDPDKYYQGFIQRAFNKAHAENTVLQLTLGWNPLIIVPQNNQIWWDADDKLLKAVSDIEINEKTISLTAIDSTELDEASVDANKKQDMGEFLWKLTLWSSRGRYPLSIDIDSPIQLKRWPNFTRHIVTPHALRIAALLIKEGPDTMIGVANALNIELRYVSIFVSAASALGLIRQVPRPKIDEVVSAATRQQANSQKRSIFNKIITKLLGR